MSWLCLKTVENLHTVASLELAKSWFILNFSIYYFGGYITVAQTSAFYPFRLDWGCWCKIRILGQTKNLLLPIYSTVTSGCWIVQRVDPIIINPKCACLCVCVRACTCGYVCGGPHNLTNTTCILALQTMHRGSQYIHLSKTVLTTPQNVCGIQLGHLELQHDNAIGTHSLSNSCEYWKRMYTEFTACPTLLLQLIQPCGLLMRA